MTKHNISKELSKISNSFSKVRLDMNKLYSLVTELQIKIEEQDKIITILNNQLDELKLNKIIKNPKTQEEQQIVGNIESKKFHYANCPYAKNIKSDNKITFDNIEQAVKSGYNECSCIREK